MADDETIDREDIIRYRLDRHILEDLRIAVATLDLDAWAEFCAEHDGDTRFGWTPPLDLDDVPTFVYCPEALSLVTDTLDDNDFTIFLDVLEWTIDRHVSLMIREPDLPMLDRITRIEDELYELNPSVVAFLSKLQFTFLGAAS